MKVSTATVETQPNVFVQGVTSDYPDTANMQVGQGRFFNDTEDEALWLVIGTPPEAANTLEMTPDELAELYPDGPKALPPELTGTR